MAVNNIFGASSIDDLADNVLSGVDDFMLTVEKMQKRKVASNVQLVVQALKKIESDLQDKYDGVTTVIEKRVSTIKDGRDGINGRDGRDGKDGRPGKDGLPGARGRDGAPGQDGADGMDGVSVVDARIDFDGSLIIVLSSGREINVGEVVTPDLAERIKVITNGGGTSQGVLDTLASLQAQINLLSSALVYAGTWNASTNTPTLASGVGTANTFYIVSVAGTTTLNGISNWGVGDWAIFNGTVWQRVEGGAEGNFTNLSVSGTTTLSGGTANGVMYLNGSKVVTTGSALAFDGTNLALGGSSPSTSSGYSKMRMNGSTGSLLELTSNGTQVLLIQADGVAAGARIVTAFNGSSPPLILGVNNLTEVLLTNDGMGLGTGITAVTSGYKLDVQAVKALTLLKSTTGTNEVFHRINNTGGNFTLGIDSAAGAQTGTGYASYLWSTANTPLVLGTNNAAVATFSAAGNLTLNTGTFTYSAGTANGVAYLNGSKVLTTGSALTFDGTNLGVNTAATALTNYRGAEFAGTTANTGGFLRMRSSDSSINSLDFTDVNGRAIFTTTNHPVRFGVNDTEAMRLTSTGLGIGTSSPGAKLGVAGSAIFSGSVPFIALSSNQTTTPAYFQYTNSTSQLDVFSSGAIDFQTGGSSASKMRLDSSGNLGLGVTPSAWLSDQKAFQLGVGGALWSNTSAPNAILGSNTYFGSGGAFRYISTAAATRYEQYLGVHSWHTAASGTAGNAIPFTQAMTLDASGNLGVGTTSPSSFDSVADNLVVGTTSGNNGITIAAGTTGASTINFADGTSGGAQYAGYIDYQHNGDYMRFGTNGGSERARITSGGDLLVGTQSTTAPGCVLAAVGRVAGTVSSVSTASFQAWNQATSGDNLFQQFYTEGGGGTLRGSIDYNRAGGLVAYNTTSDYRAKDILGPVADSGALIDSVPVYTGKMKGATQERPMFIAHEVPAYAHTGEKDAVDADGNPVYQQMDASALIPVMWAELQSLRQRVAQLEGA